MSELAKNLSITALMLVAETLAAKELYYINRTTENFESLCEKRGKLKTYIAELEAAQRWIPVSERLPEAETRVLVATPTGYMEVDWRFSEPIIDCGLANFYSLDNVTHWMPLPTPPEVQESEATSCKFCGSNKSDIRMNSIVCTSCGRKIGNIAPPEVQA